VNSSQATTWLTDARFEPYLTEADGDHEHAIALIEETIARIRKDGKTPTRGRVVAGLSFGFWRALFDRKYHQLWDTHLHRAFPHGSGDRSELASLMSRLVPFRNRVAHHETIIRRRVSLPLLTPWSMAWPISAGPRCAAWLWRIACAGVTIGIPSWNVSSSSARVS
jgi:hypothetical protein